MTTAFDALFAEWAAAAAAEDAEGEGIAFDALRKARPTDPASLARQLRWFVEQIGAADREDDALLLHVAEQLEALSAAGA